MAVLEESSLLVQGPDGILVMQGQEGNLVRHKHMLTGKARRKRRPALALSVDSVSKIL